MPINFSYVVWGLEFGGWGLGMGVWWCGRWVVHMYTHYIIKFLKMLFLLTLS